MSTVDSSPTQKLQPGMRADELRALFGTQCNDTVQAAVSAQYENGALSANAQILIGGVIPVVPAPLYLLATSPDGQTTYCATIIQDLLPASQTFQVITAWSDLFNPAQQGNQVRVGVGGFVQPPNQPRCGFWYEQTVTV